jgi:hypothetical protein
MLQACWNITRKLWQLERKTEVSYYAIHSEIIEQVLPSAEDRQKVDAARPPQKKPGLLTVGYEGKS